MQSFHIKSKLISVWFQNKKSYNFASIFLYCLTALNKYIQWCRRFSQQSNTSNIQINCLHYQSNATTDQNLNIYKEGKLNCTKNAWANREQDYAKSQPKCQNRWQTTAKLFLQSSFLTIIYWCNQKCVIIIKFPIHSSHQSIMYNPFLNFVDSFYFFALPSNPVYFTYDLSMNSPKTVPNIILAKTQSESTNLASEPQKSQETPEDPSKKIKSQRKQKQIFTLEIQKKGKRQNQVRVRGQRKGSKLQKKTEMVQKQGRNSHSNILRKFFKLLSLETQFQSTVSRIIKKLKIEVDEERYFEQVMAMNIDHRNYIRIKEVQRVFEYNSSWVNKVTRILFQNYLQNYYVEHLLSSKKTDTKSIIFHLKGKRTIRDDIFVTKSTEILCDFIQSE